MKRLLVEMENDLHTELKVAAVKQGKSLKQYITELIENSLETEKEQTH
ncbi:plasmid partition protein ParG [Enterocloster citroniae]|nr:plasmid partition protein ParG [Enterocloster citroniae]